jgi:hypothetical protein
MLFALPPTPCMVEIHALKLRPVPCDVLLLARAAAALEKKER